MEQNESMNLDEGRAKTVHAREPARDPSDHVGHVEHEILLQAFNWESYSTFGWWKALVPKVPKIAAAGFTCLWLPPFYESIAYQGYLPRDLYSLDTAYGLEEDLRNLIQTIRQHGMKAMADVVINHRIGSTRGFGGLYNRYDGMLMPWDEHAVTCDTGGLGNPSTGALFDGAPNIDLTQEFVRRDLKEWLQWIVNDVGFNGLRFDFCKGYKAKVVKEFLEASNPDFSVGEFWDTCNYEHDYALSYNQDSHRQRTVDWIDGTGGLSCAFDFTTKGILQVQGIDEFNYVTCCSFISADSYMQEAVAKKQWWRLRDSNGNAPGVVGLWPSRAVTFIENHDTGSTQNHWPFPSDRIMQGYAYILTHPGHPTVFYDHFFDWGVDIGNAIIALLEVRRRNNLHSGSSLLILEASIIYAASIDGRVSVKIGDENWDPGWGWSLSTSGQSYAVWDKAGRPQDVEARQ